MGEARIFLLQNMIQFVSQMVNSMINEGTSWNWIQIIGPLTSLIGLINKSTLPDMYSNINEFEVLLEKYKKY